jgi:hypothetical protein
MCKGVEGRVFLYSEATSSVAPSSGIVIFVICPACPCQKVEFFQAISCGNGELEYRWYSKAKLYCQQGIGVPNFIAVVLIWVLK